MCDHKVGDLVNPGSGGPMSPTRKVSYGRSIGGVVAFARGLSNVGAEEPGQHINSNSFASFKMVTNYFLKMTSQNTQQAAKIPAQRHRTVGRAASLLS